MNARKRGVGGLVSLLPRQRSGSGSGRVCGGGWMCENRNANKVVTRKEVDEKERSNCEQTNRSEPWMPSSFHLCPLLRVVVSRREWKTLAVLTHTSTNIYNTHALGILQLRISRRGRGTKIRKAFRPSHSRAFLCQHPRFSLFQARATTRLVHLRPSSFAFPPRKHCPRPPASSIVHVAQ